METQTTEFLVERPLKFFVIAGENSGDLFLSLLVRNIKTYAPNSTFRGLGGPQMEAAGVDVLSHITKSLAIIGITQVVRNIGKIKAEFNRVRDSLQCNPPDAVILCDYPGFNLRVARMAKRMGLTVIYYVLPQVWAWHKKRIKIIRENVDLMIPFLPFEKKFCDEHGITAFYGGHPLLDVIKVDRPRGDVCKRVGLDCGKPIIGLLPGSRKPEIVRILPAMLEACEQLYQHDRELQFVIPRASSVSQELLEKYIERYSVPLTIVDHERYNVRAVMDFALVKSGTATLETAILECPMIILYKTSWITWLIGKFFVKIHCIGLVNIVAGNMIVPELLQGQATGLLISETTREILYDQEKIESKRQALRRVKEQLGEPGATNKAARAIVKLLESPKSPAPAKP
ncbi:lipid-A-disaccharide synthase [Candidatus Sumerlaeota bacterium]|nr:lipid-A-disaccharide synthase [Candidatus Sumerlaeota bacterium]